MVKCDICKKKPAVMHFYLSDKPIHPEQPTIHKLYICEECKEKIREIFMKEQDPEEAQRKIWELKLEKMHKKEG